MIHRFQTGKERNKRIKKILSTQWKAIKDGNGKKNIVRLVECSSSNSACLESIRP
jgi:hypothetical protein